MNKSSYSKKNYCVYRSTHGKVKQSENSDCHHELERIEQFQEWDNWQGQQKKAKSTSSQRRRRKQVLKKKKNSMERSGMMKGKLCLYIPPRVLNFSHVDSLAAAIHVETPVRMHDDFD